MTTIRAPVAEERIKRANYLTLMAFSTGTLEPSISDRMRERKAAEKAIEAIDLGPAVTPFETAAQFVENRLAVRSFLLGDQFTAADIMIGSMMIWADKWGSHRGLPGDQTLARTPDIPAGLSTCNQQMSGKSS